MSIALDHVYTRQIGARLRANQATTEWPLVRVEPDDQPSGSAGCTQKTFTFDINLSS